MKCLDIELSRQGAGASVLAAYAHQLEEMVTNAKPVKADTTTEEGDEGDAKDCIELGTANQTQRTKPTDEADVGEEAPNAPPNANSNEANLAGSSR
ncbi:hypothetical protein FTX61_27895, partial [Nitriliruptoraceae bacterium ZYF776]|nr:hypothetical protein [Profundirhabdus halotolerans]